MQVKSRQRPLAALTSLGFLVGTTVVVLVVVVVVAAAHHCIHEPSLQSKPQYGSDDRGQSVEFTHVGFGISHHFAHFSATQLKPQ
mmetsp:Transcript_29084/g.47500  ORF Transcript_29084/g.47500 Transcript_29084/m.47500 type:complete len:85 (-) Transcript_29084:531-785(-)